jgi:hypothetical protein
MPILVAAGKTAGVPYRMTEGNSCYHGGQPGVSDARDVTAYAACMEDTLLVAAVNKSGNPVQVRLRGSAARPTECWTLTAPSLDAKDGVEFAQAGTDQRLVPAYSAMLWKLSLTRARN